MKMIIRKYFPQLVILLTSILISTLWFRHGNLMGHGESGLPFYDLSLHLKQFQHSWAEFALGHPTHIFSASYPTYWVLSGLQAMGLNGVVLQYLFFVGILASSGLGIYLLTTELFPAMQKNYSLYAVFVYWFNPFAVVGVWNRFLNNYFVFYSLLPIAAYLTLRGLNNKSHLFALKLGLLTGVFSYALTSTVFNLLLWFVIGYLVFSDSLLRKRIKFNLLFLLFSIVIFLLINSWWISQFVSFYLYGDVGVTVSSFFSSAGNLSTLDVLSKELGNLVDAVRLFHAPFYEAPAIGWAGIYNNPFSILLEFIIPTILLLTIIFHWKNRGVVILATLYFISLYLIKGNNPPLGILYNIVFLKFKFLQIFRNPFEKFGFLCQLSIAPLMAFGIYKFVSNHNYKKLLNYAFLVYFFLFFGFPVLSGAVFMSDEPPSDKFSVGFQVKVPEYYKEVRNWLIQQSGNFRMLVLPIGNEGITNTWEKGYSGLELSSQLFPGRILSYNTTIPFHHDLISGVERYIFDDEDLFSKILSIANVKYLLLRDDIDFKLRNMKDPELIRKELVGLGDSILNDPVFLGDFSIWENRNWVDKGVYATTKLSSVSDSSQFGTYRLEEIAEGSAVLQADEKYLGEIQFVNNVVFPNANFNLDYQISPKFEIRQDIFPHVRFLPGNLMYNLALVKEKAETSILKIKNIKAYIGWQIALSGKRLVEVKMVSDSNDNTLIKESFYGYRQHLTLLENELSETSGEISKSDVENLLKESYKVLINHYSIFNELTNKFKNQKELLDEVEVSKTALLNFMVNLHIAPQFGYLASEEYPVYKRRVYSFKVIEPGDYEILILSKNWGDQYKLEPNHEITFHIDGKLVRKTPVSRNDGYVSYGKLNLEKGIHELGWNTLEEKNLVDTPDELDLTVEHGNVEKRFPINSFEAGTTYKVSFEYRTELGFGPLFSFIENNDPLIKGKLKPNFSEYLGSNNYDFGYRLYEVLVTSSPSADSAEIALGIVPWNNCETIYRGIFKNRCLDGVLRSKYDKQSQVLIRNLRVERIMGDVPVLLGTNNISSANNGPNLTYLKNNSSEYEVTIENATDPYMLVLSELFDSNWFLYNEDGSVLKDVPHVLTNVYSNGWYLDKPGSYKLTIRYKPEEVLVKGKILSKLFFIAGSLILMLFSYTKKKRKV